MQQSISIVIDLFDDHVIFVGGNFWRAVHICSPQVARSGKFTERTELEGQNLLIRQSEKCRRLLIHQQSNATTLGTIFGSTCKYQLPMHRLQLPMSLAAAAKCKAVLRLAASNSKTRSPNLYVCISKSDSTDSINLCEQLSIHSYAHLGVSTVHIRM